jgi:hypothetical protein
MRGSISFTARPRTLQGTLDDREIIGSKEGTLPSRKVATGGWNKPHSEERHDSYSSPDIRFIKPRMMRWARHVVAAWQNSLHWVCIKPAKERNRFGKLVRRWENAVRMVLKVTYLICGLISPSFVTIWDTFSLSTRTVSRGFIQLATGFVMSTAQNI